MIIISEFGLKIKNIEASTLFEYNLGVRDHYEYKDAMFTNSLFSDYLKENGLRTWNDESTRDLICLEFNFGTRSYKKEMDHLYKIATKTRKEYRMAKICNDKYLLGKTYNKKEKISDLLWQAHKNRNNYVEYNTDELRKCIYNNGINVEYISRGRDGKIKKKETLHYKMLYRSTGKAKKGSCMFIVDRLYKKALNFLRMGIKLNSNPMIVEISAYSPLVSSGIVGKIKINPKNILILKDVDRYFKTNVVSIETDNNKICHANKISNYDLKNTLFDGQALIDSNIFPSWGNGYILLRHHFCKMAAFSTSIQKFFKDYFGENYYTAKISDMFGEEHYVKDIELITTDNAMKWIKFGKSYEYWCKWVYDNGCQFGIVKTAHESKLGNVQKMSYQMVNSLDINTMDNVVAESIEYINSLKKEDSVFLEYLKKNSNFSNDYEVLIALCNQNPDFVRSSYFRSRKERIIRNYILNFKSGKLIQNAENLVIVGSPYAMLLYAATGKEESVDMDDTFFVEDGTIQCHTSRFNSGEYLASFRSPFNGRGNMGYLHNVYCSKFEKYFNFGKQVIAVNMIGTDFQDRNNGSDQDSDSIYVTNLPAIVKHAKYCYANYPTIVNNIPKDSNSYNNTMDDFALVDNKLSASQLSIGESSNLAQLCLTYTYNFKDKKYDEYICILSVLAQISIDSAKRQFDIDLENEIKRIKKDIGIKEHKYPSFWLMIKNDFKKSNINYSLKCPMSYLYDFKFKKYRNKSKTLPMSYFFEKYELDTNRIKSKKIEELIQDYSLKLYENEEEKDIQNTLLLRSDFKDLIRNIQKVYISKNYLGLMSWLINRAFIITPSIKQNRTTIKSITKKNKVILLKALYDVNSSALLKIFSKNS